MSSSLHTQAATFDPIYNCKVPSYQMKGPVHLCSGFFGFYAYPAEIYQKWGTALSTFWGAWAFLLGSYIQLVETLN